MFISRRLKKWEEDTLAEEENRQWTVLEERQAEFRAPTPDTTIIGRKKEEPDVAPPDKYKSSPQRKRRKDETLQEWRRRVGNASNEKGMGE